MRLGIIRHGSTLWNKEGRAQGSSDIPLDDDGKNEARKLGERLRLEPWDLLFSSPLLRASETAEIVRESMGLEAVRHEARLREAGGGLIEGTTEQDRIDQWGEQWRQLDLGIEASDQVVARALSFIEDLKVNYPDKDILIVSHGSLIRQLLGALLPDVKRQGHLKNTSLTIIREVDGKWIYELDNCTQHLDV